MFQNFHRWLNGSFTCIKCGDSYRGMTFGYGKMICPDCYSGEDQFIIFDNRYWLNRVLHRLQKKEASDTENTLEDIIMGQDIINVDLDIIEK